MTEEHYCGNEARNTSWHIVASFDFLRRNHTNRMAQIKHTSEYKVEEILLINTTLYNAWSKEQMLLSQNKEYKYEPLKYFPGHTECLLISNEAGILRGIL